MAKALVLVEIKNGKIKKSSLEGISHLKKQGLDVDAIAFGPEAESSSAELAKNAGSQGAANLFLVNSPDLNFYQADLYAESITAQFSKGAYQI